MEDNRPLTDQRTQLQGIAAHFGLALEEVQALLSGPVMGLFERIVRLNVSPRFKNRINTLLLYQSLQEHCLGKGSVDPLAVPSRVSPVPSNCKG